MKNQHNESKTARASLPVGTYYSYLFDNKGLALI
jgi:hypothetical protein